MYIFCVLSAHFNFCVSCEVTLQVLFPSNNISIVLATFVEKSIFSFLSLVKINYSHNVGVFLFHWFILMPMPCYIDYCSFTVNLETRETDFVLFQNWCGCFRSCIFIYIWYSASQFLQHAAGILDYIPIYTSIWELPS